MLMLKRQSRLQQTTFINTFSFFSENKILDISHESSARQRINMTSGLIFFEKEK